VSARTRAHDHKHEWCTSGAQPLMQTTPSSPLRALPSHACRLQPSFIESKFTTKKAYEEWLGTTQKIAELHYYGAQGRGQQIRYALAAGGIPWDDVSAPFPPPDEVKAKWLALGGNLTTNVPMLILDGKAYTQSSAVLRHVARKGGLMPADAELQYEVDNIIAAVDDYRTEAYKAIFGVLMGAPDVAQKVETLKDTLPKHFKNFERLLGDHDYFVGDQLSVADLTAYDILTNFSFNLFPSLKAEFATLAAFADRIAAVPEIAAYIASEKFTSLMAFPKLE